MSKKDLLEFEADVVCPRCEFKYGVYALLRSGEEEYPVTCPKCKHDFQLGLTWTPKGVIAVIRETKSMIDNKKLRGAMNRGRPDRKIIMKWFLTNFGAWVIGGMFLFPLIFLFVLLSRDWALPVFALFVYWVIGLLISAILAHLSYDNYKFRLKEDHISLESGVLMMNSVSVPYMKVQEVRTNQSFLDSLLGLTSISVSTTAGVVVPGTGVSASCMLQGIKNPKPIIAYLMSRSNAPDKTHVVNKVSTEEENSSAMLEELVKIREATEMTTEKVISKVRVQHSL